jgi:hypothetical protein
MPKHNEKPHHAAEGIKLVGSPAPLIDLLFKDQELNAWVTAHIVNEGPKHKQVLSTLLVKRLYALVLAIEKSMDEVFALQKGHEITSDKNEKGDVLPITIPINLDPGMDSRKVVEAIAKAPEYEVLAYAMGLQVIEWAINATSKSRHE